jgi:hypothetical protein
MIVRPRITSDQATPFCDRTPRPAAPGQRDAIRGAGTSSKNQFRRPRRVPKVLDLAMKLSFTHQVSGTRGSRVQISPLRPGINNKSSHLASSADFGIRRNNGNESGISHRQAAGSRTPPRPCAARESSGSGTLSDPRQLPVQATAMPATWRDVEDVAWSRPGAPPARAARRLGEGEEVEGGERHREKSFAMAEIVLEFISRDFWKGVHCPTSDI